LAPCKDKIQRRRLLRSHIKKLLQGIHFTAMVTITPNIYARVKKPCLIFTN
jgi:hypothetical protein